MERARQIARESWAAAQSRREATLHALFGDKEEEPVEIKETRSPA